MKIRLQGKFCPSSITIEDNNMAGTFNIDSADLIKQLNDQGIKIGCGELIMQKEEDKYCTDRSHYRGGSDKGLFKCMDCGKLIYEFVKHLEKKEGIEPINLVNFEHRDMWGNVISFQILAQKLNELIAWMKEKK